jgi:hypothetical protein
VGAAFIQRPEGEQSIPPESIGDGRRELTRDFKRRQRTLRAALDMDAPALHRSQRALRVDLLKLRYTDDAHRVKPLYRFCTDEFYRLRAQIGAKLCVSNPDRLYSDMINQFIRARLVESWQLVFKDRIPDAFRILLNNRLDKLLHSAADPVVVRLDDGTLFCFDSDDKSLDVTFSKTGPPRITIPQSRLARRLPTRPTDTRALIESRCVELGIGTIRELSDRCGWSERSIYRVRSGVKVKRQCLRDIECCLQLPAGTLGG